MKTDRVYFYSKADGARFNEMRKALKVIDSFKDENQYDINDLIEFYQIKLYTDNKIFLPNWENELVQKIEKTVVQMWQVIISFWNTINDENIQTILEQIECWTLHKSFWEITSKLNHYKHISRQTFKDILMLEEVNISSILYQEKITDYFNHEIREFLLDYERTAELLLTEYVEKIDRDRTPLFFPKSLTLEDKETILIKYLDSEDPNLNYVRLILNIRKTQQIEISDKTLLKAKKLERKLNDKILDNGYSQEFGIAMIFDKNQKDVLKISRENNTDFYSYSMNLITKFDDLSLLLLYFHSIFPFFNKQGCIDLVSKDFEINSFEKSFMISRNSYPTSFAFRNKENRSFLMINAFDGVLQKEKKLSIEDLIKHHIVEHFEERFATSKMRFNLPSSGTKYSEKIKILLAEFDSLMKQYKLYCEEGNIDFDLLAISSKPYTFSQIPSLVKNKYYYLETDEINTELFLLFSDQASLTYVKPYEDKDYHSLYDLLQKEEVLYGNYHKYQWYRLDLLFKKGHLYVDHNGYLRIKNFDNLFVLSRLFQEEVLSYWHYSKEQRDYIDELYNAGILRSESTLFAKPEQSYFNYYLNKKEFTNGLDLRNKYMHGATSNSEEVDKNMYYILLRIIVCSVIKIDDDLRLNESKNYK